VFVTDDNPRFEDGQLLTNEIIGEIKSTGLSVINDRKTAITHAIMNSSALDIVLIAGKGHEDYQEIKGLRQPFSDREIVQAVLAL